MSQCQQEADLASRASRITAKRIKAGQLAPLNGTIPCQDCGAPATEYDHRDYQKPEEVEPVCRLCNVLRGHALNYKDTDCACPRCQAPHIDWKRGLLIKASWRKRGKPKRQG